MRKIWLHCFTFSLLITALLALAPVAWAAQYEQVANPGGGAKYKTSMEGGTVYIINNYGVSDIVEIELNAPAAVNTVFGVYMPGFSTDKSAQLGAISIKKGAINGSLMVSAGKFSDFNSSGGTVNINAGGIMLPCNYGPVATTMVDTEGKVTLRNSPSGAELLIVDGSIVTKGMTAFALVNGKIYRGTAVRDGVEIQLSLAANMEIGTPVWFAVAAAGCLETDYSRLILGNIETTIIDPLAMDFRLFFQGGGSAASSALIIGLKPGDTVRCYTDTGVVKKSAIVPAGSNMATISGIKLYLGDVLKFTVTEKGKLESASYSVAVTRQASAALKSAAITIENTVVNGASIRINSAAIGDTITVYDAFGKQIDRVLITAPPVAEGEETPLTADVVLSDLDLGPAATTIYLSATTPGKAESAWLKASVSAAK